MSETILVVDDEENIRHTLRGVLADEGFEVLLSVVGRALGTSAAPAETAAPAAAGAAPRVAPARRFPERTIARSVLVNGQGLHSGARTGLILQPLAPGSGIVFGSILSGETVPALVDHVDSTGYATTLLRGGMAARTVEHLMAALHACGVTNLLVKMQGEVPILDGSALDLCPLLDESGF